GPPAAAADDALRRAAGRAGGALFPRRAARGAAESARERSAPRAATAARAAGEGRLAWPGSAASVFEPEQVLDRLAAADEARFAAAYEHGGGARNGVVGPAQRERVRPRCGQ